MFHLDSQPQSGVLNSLLITVLLLRTHHSRKIDELIVKRIVEPYSEENDLGFQKVESQRKETVEVGDGELDLLSGTEIDGTGRDKSGVVHGDRQLDSRGELTKEQ